MSVLIVGALAAAPARAQTIVSYTVNNSQDVYIPGQSVTTPTGGPWNNIRFNFYACENATCSLQDAGAAGTLFILTQAYTGTPAGLNSTTPGYLASTSTISSGQYVFAPTVILQPSTQYFFYATAGFVWGITGTSPAGYTGGDFYGAPDANSNFVISTSPTFSADFTLSGTPPPTITSLSPNSVIVGGAAFTLTVNGGGFTSDTQVQWNGTGLTTTFVSATQLTATIAASLIATTGTANVTAASDGLTSNIVGLVINSIPANPPSIAKSFGATTIPLSGSTSLSFTITAPTTNAVSGVGFMDSLPSGLLVSNLSAITNNCGGDTSQSTVVTVILTGASLAAGGSCTISLNVTGVAVGQQNNSVTVNSTQATGNTSSASVTVANPPAIGKGFGAATIPVNGSTSLQFTILATTNAVSSVGFADSLPSGLVVSTPNGLSGSCGGGTITATAGSSSVSLSGAALAAGGSCTFSLNVTGTTAGAKNNSVSVTSDQGTGGPATATVTVANPPSIAKAFGAATIPLPGSTSLSFTITAPTTNAVSGVGFTDSLPSGLLVSNLSAITNNCGGSTSQSTVVTVILTGASLAAGGSCTISLNVTGVAVGQQNNSVTVNSTQGTGNTSSASVTVANPPVIGKGFGAATIPVNGSTSLGFTIVATTNAVSNVGFTDTLPSGLVVSTPNGLSGSCGGGTITATAGSSSVSLSGAMLAAGGDCTFSLNVTGTTAGAKNNSVSVTSDQGTGGPATATVTVANPPSIAKSFGATTIPVNGTTSLSFTITNPAGNTTSLTNVGFADTLPSGLVVSTPNALTNSCGGTAGATAGSGTVSLSGASLAASGTCTFSVNVTGNGTGQQNNSVTVSSDQSTGNTSMASVLIVMPPSITKSFGAPSVPVGETTTLTFSLNNANTGSSLSGVGFTDTLPAGLAVATPNGVTGSCGGGAITAVAGSSSVALSGSTVPSSGSCTFSVNVTGMQAGMQNNVTSGVTSIEGGAGLTATASIDVLPFLNAAGTGVEDAFQITYVSQLNNADSVINISNAGTVAVATSLDGVGVAAGNLCVNIYVYAPDQQQVACCSCLVTHNELIYLNAGGPTESTSTSWGIPVSEGGNGVPGFLWNTTYGAGHYPFNSAVVKLVATNANGPNGCFNTPFVAGSSTPANITASRITAADLAPGMSVWTTHSHPTNGAATAGPGGATLLPVNVTETEGQYKGLSFGELTGLTTLCNTIAQNSSGAGQCSCPAENQAGGFVAGLRN